MVGYRVDPEFCEALRRCRAAAGVTVRDLARAVLSSKTHVHDFETGRHVPSPDLAGRIDDVLRAGGVLKAMVRRTHAGARDFTDIRSYLATAVKHGIRFIDALTTLTEHRPWLPSPA